MAQRLTRGGRGQGHGPVVGEGARLKLHVLLPSLHLHLPLKEHGSGLQTELRRKKHLGRKSLRHEGDARSEQGCGPRGGASSRALETQGLNGGLAGGGPATGSRGSRAGKQVRGRLGHGGQGGAGAPAGRG